MEHEAEKISGAQRGDNRSGPVFGDKGGKERERNQVCKGRGKGERDVSALILIPLLNVENYLSCAC